MNSQSQRYFSRQAQAYTTRSAGLLWSWLRKRESQLIMSLLAAQPGELILDAGCGSGYYTGLILSANAIPIAIDAVPNMSAACHLQTGAAVASADIIHAPFKPVFDRILCAGALEFTSDPFAAVRSMATLLRVDSPGVLVLHFPADNPLGRIYKRYHASHGLSIRLFSEADCAAIAAQLEGFSIDAHKRSLFNHVMRIKKSAV